MKKMTLYKYMLAVFAVMTLIFSLTGYFLKPILYFLSPKGYVKDNTADKVFVILIILYSAAVLLLLFIISLPKIRTKALIIYGYFSDLEINIKPLLNISMILLFAYVFISPLFITAYMDISTDESTYINTGKNLFEKGKLFYEMGNDEYVIPKDMYVPNMVMFFARPFFNYSFLVPRIITYALSMLLVVLLIYHFKDMRRILLLLLASSPAFIFLSGTSYAENIALIPAFMSIFLLEKYTGGSKNSYLYMSSLLFALATMTKIQLGVIMFASLGLISLIAFFRGREYLPYIKLFLYSFILVFVLSLSTWLFLYNIQEIKKVLTLYYAYSYSSVSNSENLFNILINIERFFNFQTVFLASVVVSYFISWQKEKTFIEKYFFIVVLLNAAWFILMKGHNYRFMYFSQIGILLLSVRPLAQILNSENKYYRNIVKIFLALFLTVGIIQNTKLSVNGVSNDYLIYLNNNNPFKTYHVFKHDDSQKIFYDEMKKILPENETVFYIGAEAEIMGHINNRFISFTFENYENNKDFKYIIRTAVNDELGINANYNSYLGENCDLIYKCGKYALYKIKF